MPHLAVVFYVAFETISNGNMQLWARFPKNVHGINFPGISCKGLVVSKGEIFAKRSFNVTKWKRETARKEIKGSVQSPNAQNREEKERGEKVEKEERKEC